MAKFLVGLALGLTIGFVGFKHQVKKVDEYSFKVAYMQGRLDQAQVSGDDLNATLQMACRIYVVDHYDTTVPFGYTEGPSDHNLKDLCLNQ